jgi:hypothetical protein
MDGTAPAQPCCIGKSDVEDENYSLVECSDVFYRLLASSTETFSDSEAIMSMHRQHSDSSTSVSNPRPVARERTINPLWMVTFAAGLVFGMLAVLLTSG